MRLVINKEKDIDENFIQYLIKKIQEKILASINSKKLIKWDKYLLNIFNNKLIKKVNTKEIFLIGLHYLEYIETKENFIIQINPNVKYRDTNFTILSLIKLINYGCVGIQGYPIISNTFEEFQKKIKIYKNKYITEGPLYARIKVI